jgi:hypothetical protein
MRWTQGAACNRLRGRTVRLRTAKSCGPGAPGLALSLRDIFAGDGDSEVMDTGESAKRPLKPSRRECRLFGFTCGDYACVLS